MVDGPVMPGTTPDEDIQLSSRLANPLDMVELRPSGNYMVSGIIAILTTLCFVALLVIEWLDWNAIAYV